MCCTAMDESWHEAHAAVSGESTSVVPAASVVTPLAALNEKPLP